MLEPVDNEKLVARAAARAALANRIREYRPQAIVSLLMRIEKVVRQAAAEAECGADFFAVPFSRPRKSEAVPRADGGHRSEAPVRGPGESFSDVILRLVEIEGKRHVQSE